MKERILHWLKSDRTYNNGVAFYQKYGKSLSLKAILNRQGETTYNKNLLTEELRKLAGIDPDELKHLLSSPVTNVVEEEATLDASENQLEEPTTLGQQPELAETGKKKASPSVSEKGPGSEKNSPS